MSNLNDCFALSDERLTVAEALDRFSTGISPVGQMEEVDLADAIGRILFSDIISEITVPPHDNSAVDGYAVFIEDLAKNSPTKLPITGRVAAGHPLERSAHRGEALSIFTGAQIPTGELSDGPDTIFMLEDVTLEENSVILPPGQLKGSNIRKAGEDVMKGDVVLKLGQRLRPQDVGMAAAIGLSKLIVRKKLKVAVFSTGDEIRDPGNKLDDAAIYDINRHTIRSLLQNLNCQTTDLGIFPDDPIHIREAIQEAAEGNDLLITSGGVSKGEEDHVRPAIESLGELHIWNILIKPGRPIALGFVLDGAREVPIIGLPGNPVAVLVTFLRIARPIILLLAGAKEIEPNLFQVQAGFTISKKPGRREWLRACLRKDKKGVLRAIKHPNDGSGVLSSMVAADGLIELSEEVTEIVEGQTVDFLPFSEVI